MKENQLQKEESGILSMIAFRYLPFWPLFLVFVAIGVAASWAYVKYTVPLYEAHATIMVKDEKKGFDDAKLLDALNIYAPSKIVENEIEVLRSRSIMTEVVKQLHLYAPVMEEGKIKSMPAYRSSPVVVEAKNPELLKATDKIHFRFNRNREVVIGNKRYALNQWVKTQYGELRFLENAARIRDPLDPLYFKLEKLSAVTEKYVARLDVAASSKLSSVINLSIKDGSRKRGEDVLEKVLENYNQLSIREKNKLAANTLSFVNERLAFVEAELDSMESAIQRFKSRKKVTNLSEEGRLYLHSVADNNQRSADISVQLAVLDQIEKYVTTRDQSSSILPSTLGVTDPVLGQLLQKLRDTEIKYQVLSKTTPEKHPLAVAMVNEMENLRPAILENIRNQQQSLRTTKAQVESNTGSYFAQLQLLPLKERELFDLSRQQLIINDVYTFLLHKREETALSYASTVADSWVVNAPLSGAAPVSPNKVMIYFVGIALSIALAVLVVMGREVMNKKILFRTEIEAVTSVPVAAELLLVKGRQERQIPTDRPSALAEQFRRLRVATGLYGKDAGAKKLMVSSSISGEGKSFVSLNLALSLALSGKKVLLLDLDLRNPAITEMTGMQNQPGITEFLQQEVPAEMIIRNLIHKNLFVAGAGKEVVNPTELLMGDRIEALFGLVENDFDFLVMDTAPVVAVTDAYLLSNYADKTLFVIRHRYTPKNLLQSFDHTTRIRVLNNVSIVFNGIRSRGLVNGKFGYGTGYGYEYLYKEKPRKALRKKQKN